MQRPHVRYLLILLALLAGPVAHAQEGIGKKQQEKIQAKKKEDDKKEVKKEEKRLYKQHLANQDKATRKRMKRHKRRADNQGNTGHRDPFLRRLFGSKH
jgi:hypothetical protein